MVSGQTFDNSRYRLTSMSFKQSLYDMTVPACMRMLSLIDSTLSQIYASLLKQGSRQVEDSKLMAVRLYDLPQLGTQVLGHVWLNV